VANRQNKQPGLKPKDLCLIPERVALAAQAAGWYVRSRIIWWKDNPMPSSQKDRPTNSHETIWMFTKSKRYYWDGEAVRERTSGGAHARRTDGMRDGTGTKVDSAIRGTHEGWEDAYQPSSRNLRDVWKFPTQPFSGAHFATFAQEMPRRCILAATSERGCCAQCQAPWERVVRASGGTIGKSWHDHSSDLEEGLQQVDGAEIRRGYQDYERRTVGWRPTCACRGQRGKTIPCTVLDPFSGSGTTGRVALELNRRAVLNDLAYQELAEKRTTGVQRNLL
jgi:hypothetical protein